MSGLIFIVIFCVWAGICLSIAKLITRNISKYFIKKSIFISISILFFIAPVFDEVLGGFQFRSLCKERVSFVVDEESARGRTVISHGAHKKRLDGYAIPIVEEYWSYKDKGTDEIIVSWTSFKAEGGWLSREIKLFQSVGPYTFEGACSPVFKKSIFSDLNIIRSTN